MTSAVRELRRREGRRRVFPHGLACLLALALCAVTVADAPWQAAAPGRAIVLPDDHRSHPEYRLEWWYYTGTLFTDRGRRFGYQLTFFRIGIHAEPPTPSRWALRDLHMAHLAVTDVAAKAHLSAERLNRSGAGWAGPSTSGYRVWNDGWSAALEGREHRLIATSRDPAMALDLRLEETRPPALHGLHGFSQKGSLPGNASYYYSLTRMPTRGTLRIGGDTFPVEGASWMDHEFGTTFLERDRAGWDWFSIQLADGRDLMLFQLRGRDGSVDPRTSGTLVATDGRTRSLDRTVIRVEPLRHWTSPGTGGRYPVAWRVRIPGEGLALEVRAVMDAQEMAGLPSGLSYWEGAVDVSGTDRGRAVSGVGYLEMTGYSGPPMGEMMEAPR